MNHTAHTALVLNQHRAAQLDIENERRRQHAERATASATSRPTGFAVVTGWFARILRVPATPAMPARPRLDLAGGSASQ